MRRYELDDARWELIKDFFPTTRRRGRPWRDHRTILNGIIWLLSSGAPWRDMPEYYGPWQMVYDRFRRWCRDGTWDRILAALQMKLDERGLLEWAQWCIDSSSVRASRAAAGGGKRGALTSRRTTRSAGRGVGSARRSTW